MPKQLVRVTTNLDPYGWRAGTLRVVANAALVLLVFEVVTVGAGAAQTIVTGTTIPLAPVELVTLVTVFLVVRWVFVLPGLLPVLVGIEYVARRAPHPRVLTAVVAFAPMVLWELLSRSPGDISPQGWILGVTAVLFAALARLPARYRARSTEGRGAAQPPAGTAVAPR